MNLKKTVFYDCPNAFSKAEISGSFQPAVVVFDWCFYFKKRSVGVKDLLFAVLGLIVGNQFHCVVITQLNRLTVLSYSAKKCLFHRGNNTADSIF
jgi:hypothetical protein